MFEYGMSHRMTEKTIVLNSLIALHNITAALYFFRVVKSYIQVGLFNREKKKCLLFASSSLFSPSGL